jgi:hypothetical protein
MENKFKGTPGPWVAGSHDYSFEQRNDVGYIPIYTGDPDRGWIAEAKGNHVNDGMTAEEMTANARLIAAAPTMLETLERITNCNDLATAQEYAREMISKATEK